MPRIRTVKPEHWDDEKLPLIFLQAHLLWIGMWNFSDDKGAITTDAQYIKSKVFPRRKEIRIEQIEQWLGQLVNARFIIPFKYRKEGYYLSRTFLVHQRLDKPLPSKIPDKVIESVKNITLIGSYETRSGIPNLNDVGDIINKESTDMHIWDVNTVTKTGQYSKGEESNGEDIDSPDGESAAEKKSRYKSLDKNKREIYKFIKEEKPDFIEPYFDLWNIFAEEKKIAKVLEITQSRKQKFNVRIKQNGFDLIEVLRIAGQSEFILTGAWFTWDWVMKNDKNYLKVLEGNYKNSANGNGKQNGQTQPTTGRKSAGAAKLVDELKAEINAGGGEDL